jgi:hypothetical protein
VTPFITGITEEVISNYPIDRSRLYLTGLSLGGGGVFTFDTNQPNYFAASVPICGGINKTQAYLIKDVNMWAFHAVDDNVVYVENTRDVINAMRTLGGNPLYTEYPSGGHGIWGTVYNTNAMYDWMFAQRGEGVITSEGKRPPAANLMCTETDLGNGLIRYLFEIYCEDTFELQYYVTAAFRGVGGATIHQVNAFGAVSVNNETDADYWSGIPAANYNKAEDTWFLNGWTGITGVNPIDGSPIDSSGAQAGENLFAISVYRTDRLWMPVQLAQVVADGPVEWVGSMHHRYLTHDLFYEFEGTTAAPLLPGDYNDDGYVDLADYTLWADHFGQVGADLPGDGNGDGVVDLADYTVWAEHFGQGVTP